MKHYLFIDCWTLYFPNDGIDHVKVVFITNYAINDKVGYVIIGIYIFKVYF